MNQASPYYAASEFTTTLRGHTLAVVSKPGMPNWDHVTRAQQLLAESVRVVDDAKALVLGCGHGALGAALALDAPAGQVQLVDPNFVALAMAERTLRRNGAGNARIDEILSSGAGVADPCDVVVMELPTGRKLARRWLLLAHAALRDGGALYLAGPNDEGIQAAIGDARVLFGEVATLGYKERNRVARVTKQATPDRLPAWAAEPGIAPGTWYDFEPEVQGEQFRLRSQPGVFAFDRIDDGTALLLSVLPVPGGGAVLDIGCGHGIIGLVASRRGAGQIDMVDTSLPAVAAARENIARNDAPNAAAFPSDALSAVADRRYDLIVTNPPFHAGKAVDYDMAQTFVEGSRPLLHPGGQLVLVANKFIRYERQMRSYFARIDVLAETGRYHVLAGR